MQHLTRSRFAELAVALALAGLWSTAGIAQIADAPPPPGTERTAPSGGDTIRLTDQERDAILDRSTTESAAAARGELGETDGLTRGIHGEVGAFVGTNGARGAYGTAAIPLGADAGAVVSFESDRTAWPRR